MQTKPLLYGLVGFFIGGFIVSVAATTFDKPGSKEISTNTSMTSMTMDNMTSALKGKTGDEYDKAFIANMIVHHEGAVEMAKFSMENAKHDEIKELSSAIITAQQKEIAEMKQWQKDWGYSANDSPTHPTH